MGTKRDSISHGFILDLDVREIVGTMHKAQP
jgi:hypothetical protein